MQKRTIEDIHNKDIGHKKFALFVDMAMEKGYKITEIKEYYEKFKFKMNGWPIEFDKNPKLNFKWQFELCEKVVKQNEQLKLLKV